MKTIAALFASLSVASFAVEPVLIEKSQSPDGTKAIVIVPSAEPDAGASGTLKIKDSKTGKLSGEFEWGSFGSKVTSDAVDVLWSPDSKTAAISWFQTRGYRWCTVYTELSGGWQEVKMPSFCSIIAELSGIKELHTHGHELPLKWLSPNQLLVQVGNALIPELKEPVGDTEQLFWFTINLLIPKGKKELAAVIEKVELAPDSAYDYNKKQ